MRARRAKVATSSDISAHPTKSDRSYSKRSVAVSRNDLWAKVGSGFTSGT